MAAMPGILSDVGKVVGGATSGAAAGRATDAELQLKNQQLAQSGAGMQMQQAEALQKSKQEALANLIRGGLLSGMTDPTMSGIPASVAAKTPTLSGGMRPSAIAGAAGIGGQYSDAGRSALMSLLGAKDPTSMLAGINIPGAATLPQPSTLSKIGSWVSPIASILGLVGTDLNKPQNQSLPIFSNKSGSPAYNFGGAGG